MRKVLFKKGLTLGILTLLIITFIPLGSSINQKVILKNGNNDEPQTTFEPIKNENPSVIKEPLKTLRFGSDDRLDQIWWNSNWNYRKSITIDHTKIAGTLTNFPILVWTIMNGSKVQSEGDDIVFIYNGQKLYHEIESYNNATGLLIVWVNLTSINSTQDTVLYIYYGNPTCLNQQNQAGTWYENFRAVWHMNDNTTSTISDSTAYHNDGMKKASNSPIQSIGKIGYCQLFSGSNWIDVSDNPFDFSTGPFSITIWYKSENIDTGMFITKRDYDTFETGYLFYKYQQTTRFYISEDSANKEAFYNNPQTVSGWHQICGVRDGDIIRFYFDGDLKASTPGAGLYTLSNSWNLVIGTDRTHNYGCVMQIDEAIIMSTALNTSWINTSYKNQNSPATFMTFGTEEIVNIPNVNFSYNPTNPTNITILHFNDTSTIMNGTIIEWWWDFGDYYYSTLQNPTHLYTSDGTYNVTLTVTSNNGAINSTQKTIVVYTPTNLPPNQPSSPNPTNGSMNVTIFTDLMWIGGDPDPSDTVRYDVYFGISLSPPQVGYNQSTTMYDPGILSHETAYYWRIVAWDNHTAHTEGPIWHFTTKQNSAPTAPFINGATQGTAGESYNYTFVATDPDDDDLYYWIDWGDGQVDDWFGPCTSNLVITRSHQWAEKGTYLIQAQAKDVYGAIGNWGSLSVTMPTDFVLGYRSSQQIISYQLKKIIS